MNGSRVWVVLWLSLAFGSIGLVAIGLGIASYIAAWRQARGGGRSLAQRWKDWRLRRSLTDAEWLVGRAVFGVQLDLKTIAGRYASRLSLSDLMTAIARLRELGIINVKSFGPPDPRSLVSLGPVSGAVYWIKKRGESPEKADERLQGEADRRLARLKSGSPQLTGEPLRRLYRLLRLGEALFMELCDQTRLTPGETVPYYDAWRSQVSEALPVEFRAAWAALRPETHRLPFLTMNEAVSWLGDVVMVLSIPKGDPMPDERKPIPLDDALRIIMKVPPARGCDEEPTEDGDDVVDTDEEADGE